MFHSATYFPLYYYEVGKDVIQALVFLFFFFNRLLCPSCPNSISQGINPPSIFLFGLTKQITLCEHALCKALLSINTIKLDLSDHGLVFSQMLAWQNKLISNHNLAIEKSAIGHIDDHSKMEIIMPKMLILWPWMSKGCMLPEVNNTSGKALWKYADVFLFW